MNKVTLIRLPILLNLFPGRLVKFCELGGDLCLESLFFNKWIDCLQIHEVTYPNIVRYFTTISLAPKKIS